VGRKKGSKNKKTVSDDVLKLAKNIVGHNADVEDDIIELPDKWKVGVRVIYPKNIVKYSNTTMYSKVLDESHYEDFQVYMTKEMSQLRIDNVEIVPSDIECENVRDYKLRFMFLEWHKSLEPRQKFEKALKEIIYDRFKCFWKTWWEHTKAPLELTNADGLPTWTCKHRRGDPARTLTEKQGIRIDVHLDNWGDKYIPYCFSLCRDGGCINDGSTEDEMCSATIRTSIEQHRKVKHAKRDGALVGEEDKSDGDNRDNNDGSKRKSRRTKVRDGKKPSRGRRCSSS